MKSIVNFDRFMALFTKAVFGATFKPDADIAMTLLPPKRSVKHGYSFRQCRSVRNALDIGVADSDNPMKDAFMYHYIGGGVPLQPPNTLSLVYKHLPLGVAYRLLSCEHFLAQSEVC